MSLLLDALKKAAHEKQIAAGEVNANESNSASLNSANKHVDDALDFSLDDDQANTDAEIYDTDIDTAKTVTTNLTLEPKPEASSTSTVSDEALDMLVYKTNKQYRINRRNIWGSIFIGAAIILLVAGVFQYYIMLQGVEDLERKHAMAMRAVQSLPVETSRSHVFQIKSESDKDKAVIDVDSSVAAVNDGVVTSQTDSIKDKSTTKARSTTEVKKTVSKARLNTSKSVGAYEIKKTRKLDPVYALLERGWQAYEEQDYEKSSQAYREVLQRESNNRDALLGIAAIAVKQADYETARLRYAHLLKLDPRDQIAASAMASLDKATPYAQSESKLKYLLQQQPEAAHLHFALGNQYAQQNKWHQAQLEYFNAWSAENNNADYAYNLAVSLDKIGKREQASRFYLSSLELARHQNVNFSIDSVTQRLQQLNAK